MFQTRSFSGIAALILVASAGRAQTAATNTELKDRAYAAELVSDASNRTSFSENSGGGGFENGKFMIHDGSGANSLVIGGTILFRYSADFRDDSGVDEDEDFTQGFSSRRTRLRFGGSIWDKNLTYLVALDANRTDGEMGVVDAYGQYKWSNGVTFKWGQYKLPFLREESISDTALLLADTSVAHSVFTQTRSQGIEVGYESGDFRVMGDLSDGIRTLNTEFNSNVEADFAVTGRAEWRFAGKDWKRFSDYTSWRGADFAGMLGGAVHYQSGGETGGIDNTGAADGTNDRDLFMATVDTQFEGNGWNAAVAGMYRNDDNDESSESDAFDDFGFLVQGGVFVTEQVEAFARYDVVFMDGDRSAAPDGDDSFHTVTAGANYYVSPDSHAVKVVGQVSYYFNPTVDVEIISPATTTPLLRDTEDGQVALILKVQIMF